MLRGEGLLLLCALCLRWGGVGGFGGAPSPDAREEPPLPRRVFGGGIPPHDPDAPHHEQFLGPDEAKVFEGLPPAESRRRLALLVPLMDADADGRVSAAELGGWLSRRRARARDESLRRGLERHDGDGDGRVTWAEYRGGLFGEGEEPPPASHRALLERERRRFGAADGDGDGGLDPPELEALLHPETCPRMGRTLAAETMEDLDRDGDGFIQEDEYIAALYEPPPGTPAPPEPGWVGEERRQFRGGRDLDGDGRLDPREVEHWLRPPPHDWATVEAAHLLHRSDRDQDGHLTREEILDQWELFVGSDPAHELPIPHDEL